MKRVYDLSCRIFIACFLLVCSHTSVYASHIVGADLSYTYVSGNTYNIIITLYGDCGSTTGAFETLQYSSPQVCIYNGTTNVMSANLTIQPPTAGVEVTDVASGTVTQCTNTASSVPGIKKFVYSATITLPYTSATWRFIYGGYNGTGSAAGRAASITNIVAPGSTIIQLIDTLNNSTYYNTTPSLNTTMPYFYAINQHDTYDPAAVDTIGDSLAFYFVPATDGSGASGTCTIGGDDTYTGMAWAGTPVSAATPLQVVADSFSMNTATGQLAFHPDIFQRGIIEYNVRQFHSGVLVGTSQREMTVMVMTPPATCSGTPVAGGIYSNTLLVCSANVLTLTDTGSTTGAFYRWQSSPDSITWNSTPGTTAIYSFSGVTATTYYRCMVTCASGGASDSTAGIKIVYTDTCSCLLTSAGTALANVTHASSTTSITLTDSGYSASPVTMQWQSSPDSVAWSNVSGATNASYSFTGLAATTYYRLKFICTVDGDTIVSPGVKIIYAITTTGTPSLSASGIKVFPNPTTNDLSIIQSPSAYSSFTITNSIGQDMIQQALTTTQTIVNVATLPPGLYYIIFRGDNGTSVQKFIKL